MDSALLAMIMKLQKSAVTIPPHPYENQIPITYGNSVIWTTLISDHADRFVELNFNSGLARAKDIVFGITGQGSVVPRLTLKIAPTLNMFQELLVNGSITFSWEDLESHPIPIFNDSSVELYECITVGYGPDAFALLPFYGANANYARFAGKLHLEGYSAMGVPDGDYPMVLLYDFDTNEFTIQCSLGGT